jgi:hypothetical protein
MFDWYTYEMPLSASNLMKRYSCCDNICDHISPIGKMCYDSSKSALSTFIPGSLSGCALKKGEGTNGSDDSSKGLRDNIARLAHIQ